MRIVDEETRRIVQKNRLDALEGDHLFDVLNFGETQLGDNEQLGGGNEAEQEEWGEDDDFEDESEDDEISSSGIDDDDDSVRAKAKNEAQ